MPSLSKSVSQSSAHVRRLLMKHQKLKEEAQIYITKNRELYRKKMREAESVLEEITRYTG